LRKSLQLAAERQYGLSNADKPGDNRDLESQDCPQPMLVFLTDGIATVGELLTARILAEVRALNTEIRVRY
jgi:hypothetical protein